MKDLLSRHLNTSIGLNLMDPSELVVMDLVTVEDTYFGVLDREKGLTYNFPYSIVLRAIDSDGGLTFGRLFGKRSVSMIIYVYHQIIYTGARSTGFSIGF